MFYLPDGLEGGPFPGPPRLPVIGGFGIFTFSPRVILTSRGGAPTALRSVDGAAGSLFPLAFITGASGFAGSLFPLGFITGTSDFAGFLFPPGFITGASGFAGGWAVL